MNPCLPQYPYGGHLIADSGSVTILSGRQNSPPP